MYEYSDLFCNNHLSMFPDYMFSYDIIPNLIASVTQRNLYLIDAKLWIMYVVCPFPPPVSPFPHFQQGLVLSQKDRMTDVGIKVPRPLPVALPILICLPGKHVVRLLCRRTRACARSIRKYGEHKA